MQSFKYLGTILTGNFEFSLDINAIVSKVRQRLYILKRLKYTDADATLYNVYYSAFIKIVSCYHLVPFYDHISAKSAQVIRRVTFTANTNTNTV